MEALADISDESLDFVFIDAGHTYDDVKKDVEEWAKKVRVGGIVSGHDYYESKEGRYGLGIIKAVDEYIKKTGYVLQIIGWDKENPDRDSRQPCWYFVKDT
jgi:predicted O-methyltransferase YrrM